MQPDGYSVYEAQQRVTEYVNELSQMQVTGGVNINGVYWAAPHEILRRNRNLGEKVEVERFINTGATNLDVFGYPDGTLAVFGNRDFGPNLLFKLDKTTIVAKSDNAKAVKELLAILAKREGLALKFVKTLRVGSSGKKVSYYAFKNRPEVDDSELVSVTKFAMERQEHTVDFEEGREPFCECDDYCHGCERHVCVCDDEDFDGEDC